MNFLPATLANGALRIAGHALALPPGRFLPEGDLKLGVRPEYVVESSEGDTAALPFTVTMVQDIGTHFMLTANLGANILKVRLAPEASVPAAGQIVWLRVIGPHTCFYRNEELVDA